MLNQLKTILLLGLLSATLAGMGSLLGGGWLPLFLGVALVMNLGAYFFSDRLVLRMHAAVEVGESENPRLHAMVAELAERAGIPKPRVYRIPEAAPNAFATGRNPGHGVVAVTDGLLQLLSERELRGVIAHEIAHIRNRDVLVATVAAVMASVVGSLASTLQWMSILGSDEEEEGGGWGGLLMALVAPLLATLLQMAISRSREYLADAEAARLTGDPEALAWALQRLEMQSLPMEQPRPATASLFIVNPFASMERVARWFSTHPPTEDRVEHLLGLRILSRERQIA